MQLFKIENSISSGLSILFPSIDEAFKESKDIHHRQKGKEDSIDKNYCTIKLILILILFQKPISSNISGNISDKRITQHL